MRSRAQRWMLWAIVSLSSTVAFLALVLRVSVAGDPQILHNTRPADTLVERLERPRPEQDTVRQGTLPAQLTQGEVVRLAHTAAKQKLGESYQAYGLKSAMFDQHDRHWTVTFTQETSSSTSDGCLVVLVHDGSREMISHPCR